jgi:hypothetical protein
MSRFTNYLPYTPGGAPNINTALDIVRAVWDELYRISQSFIDFDRPVSLSLGTNEPLNATTTPGTWTRLFNGGEQSQWEQPGGSFDHATGIYTVATEGLYNIYIRLSTPPFPSAQTKDYQSQMQITVDYIKPGKLDAVVIVEDGGLDTHYLTNQGQLLIPLYQGDKFYADARLIRQAGAASNIQNNATLQILRVSGIK